MFNVINLFDILAGCGHEDDDLLSKSRSRNSGIMTGPAKDSDLRSGKG
jgi:hypothetical protein